MGYDLVMSDVLFFSDVAHFRVQILDELRNQGQRLTETSVIVLNLVETDLTIFQLFLELLGVYDLLALCFRQLLSQLILWHDVVCIHVVFMTALRI